MNTDFFDKLRDERENEVARIDARFAVRVRSHLVALFRKAHEVDPELEGVIVGMGTASLDGQYMAIGEENTGCSEDDGPRLMEAAHWHPDGGKGDWPKNQPTLDFFRAVHAYDDLLCNGLGYINDITLDDIPNRFNR